MNTCIYIKVSWEIGKTLQRVWVNPLEKKFLTLEVISYIIYIYIYIYIYIGMEGLIKQSMMNYMIGTYALKELS